MAITVIMTCHNEEQFIEQAIRSVVDQTAYSEIAEIIVVNDGSSDGSQALLEQLSDEIDKLRIIPADGIGLPGARNLALKEARGDLIALLDGDDYWTPGKTAAQLAVLAKAPTVGLVYSDFYDFTLPDASDARLVLVRAYQASNDKLLEEYFIHDAPVIPSTAIIRRAVFDDVGPFDAEIRLGEDTEMFLRIAENWRFQHVPGGFLYKRRHGKNLTARLGGLLPVAIRLTERFTARNPRLKPLAAKRMARRYAATANDCAKHGERNEALGYLWQAFQSDPPYWRIYAYLAISLLPAWIGPALRQSFWTVRRAIRGRTA
ncbi:glycosyl transferase family 2 [Parvibaculum lavamentivorans DS-1]|uniref:Glycosyl transferase family 2 n=1 Tax=Parvibaculum lavamentivorans (strain DS-1 / DSM 13023 / NCIMB 13966) TaxID=402881 RepID=A7HUE9_PARL1|nr:glycosyltransferase family 2 protein [Parvibaculum lavamentivorans]ABS63532.1 glycosyl transferase family 2 [Parvibaculum lavamentivorans DS-1]